MKRIRRILSIEHREISASITQTITESGSATGDTGLPDRLKESTPANCPECGSAWLMDLQHAVQQGRIDIALLQSAILNRRLHCHWQPDGQLWICQRSLQEIEEKPG
jgi:hypothetical protein